jgi:TRAP-type C4-dicarboxylate transport system substrate-binding protein
MYHASPYLVIVGGSRLRARFAMTGQVLSTLAPCIELAVVVRWVRRHECVDRPTRRIAATLSSMPPRRFLALWPFLAFSVASFSVSSPGPAEAQEAAPIVLRIATLTPRGSAWHRVFTAWSQSLRAATAGRLTIQVQPTDVGDEREVVRRLRAKEIDGASLTAVGLAQIAPPVLVLEAPGIVDSDGALDRVRTALDGELRRAFEQQGVTLLGWTEYGRARIFSTRPIVRPTDLRTAHPWLLPDDPIGPALLQVVGAVGVSAPIGEVLQALHEGRIDTVVASAIAVNALQWHTRLTHVTHFSSAVVVGATVISRERYEALPVDLQTALRDTARQAHDLLQRTVRLDDDRAYQALLQRGMIPVDASAHQAEWHQVAHQTRQRLVGRYFTRELLDRAITSSR